MSIFHVFLSPQAKKTADLHRKLKRLDKVNAPFPETLVHIAAHETDVETVSSLLQSKKADIDIRNKSRILHNIIQAQKQLDQGHTEQAVNLYQDFPDMGGSLFMALTNGTVTKAKMDAKQQLFLKNYKPSGDHGDPSFGKIVNFSLEQQRAAINGYAKLDLQQECEQAMRNYIQFDVFTAHATKEIKSSADHLIKDGRATTLSLSAVNIAQEKNMMNLHDHLNLIDKHPDDQQRVCSIHKAVQTLEDDMYMTSKWSQDHSDAFTALIKHVSKAPDSETPDSASKKLAINILNNNKHFQAMRDRLEAEKQREIRDFHETYGTKPDMVDYGEHVSETDRASDYYHVMINGLRMNDPAIMETTFKTPETTARFVQDYQMFKEYAFQKDMTLFETIQDIMPDHVKGMNAVKSRAHLAQQYMVMAASSYTRDQAPRQPDQKARIAAYMAGQAIMDPTVQPDHIAKDDAKNTLLALQSVEKFAITAKVTQTRLFAERQYKTADIESVEKTFGSGFGYAMTDFLQNAKYIAPAENQGPTGNMGMTQLYQNKPAN